MPHNGAAGSLMPDIRLHLICLMAVKKGLDSRAGPYTHSRHHTRRDGCTCKARATPRVSAAVRLGLKVLKAPERQYASMTGKRQEVPQNRGVTARAARHFSVPVSLARAVPPFFVLVISVRYKLESPKRKSCQGKKHF